MNTNTMQTIKVLVLALILAVGVNVALAQWIAAPATPPNCDSSYAQGCNAPVNVGTTQQSKLGALWVNTGTGTLPSIGLLVNRGLKVTSVIGSDARVYVDEYADSGSQHAGLDLRENGDFKGGFFKRGGTNDIEIWRKDAPVITVKQNGQTEFEGQVKIKGGSPGSGKVLTSDSEGTASWQTPASGGSSSGASCSYVFNNGVSPIEVSIVANGKNLCNTIGGCTFRITAYKTNGANEPVATAFSNANPMVQNSDGNWAFGALPGKNGNAVDTAIYSNNTAGMNAYIYDDKSGTETSKDQVTFTGSSTYNFEIAVCSASGINGLF